MRILPILFNTDMVRAILDGRKTVTRRCVKYKYSNTEMKMHTDKYGTRLIEIQKDIEGETHGKNPDGSTWHKLLGYIEPKQPYKRGDILYVRETWCEYGDLDDAEQIIDGTEKYYYRADGENPTPYNYFLVHRNGYDDRRDFPVWRPSIHMPKEAARIWLMVKDVRAERLQDMNEVDTAKEGIRTDVQMMRLDDPDFIENFGGIELFKDLWNSTIKKSDLDRYGWDANPWVWVIEFERCEKPEEI